MAFSISEHIENGFLVTYLIDESTDTRVGILPACGAILHEFSIPRDGGERLNVVDNYSSKEAYDVHKETLGFKSAKMNPYVCRVEKGAYNFEDAAYKLDKYYLGDHAMQ